MRVHVKIVCLLVAALQSVTSERSFDKFNKEIKHVSYKNNDDPGEPLLITPYLEQGKNEEARNLSMVTEEYFLGIRSYSGYFTVNETHDSNMFFWFFPAKNVDYQKAPLILWLQGGPGSPSTFGLFNENGPFEVLEQNISLRQSSWSFNHSVLYLDNPVGTGFSFTDGRWCKDQNEVAEDLYTALTQFFQLFPELQGNEFFISGESFAGKYVPFLSNTIHEKNVNADLKINLKGLSIGNGVCDIQYQMNYGDYLYEIGLIDKNNSNQLKDLENRVANLIQEQKYVEAFNLYDIILIGSTMDYPTLFKNFTGYDNYYNFLLPSTMLNYLTYIDFIQQGHIRKALHVGNMSLTSDSEVFENLKYDYVMSAAPVISNVLSHYRVLFYNGQLDICIAYPLTVNFLNHLNFSSSEEYKNADRYQWFVDNELAGYVKEAGNLTEVLVRNAGHMVPAEQPVWALDLISKFVRNIPLH